MRDRVGPDRIGELRRPALDEVVLDLNRRAQAATPAQSRIEVAHGATHQFEEPGTPAQVAELARAWFTTHLPSPLSPLHHRMQR
ncbi:hypothetical protein ACFTWF_44020 [Rhodococcus sp. NPDC056960]|uniref:hypothetical protein n=1 Tax=Rhodococcus sp. NPDC056960 TaxID=3345982 RepID=UPI00363F7CFE